MTQSTYPVWFGPPQRPLFGSYHPSRHADGQRAAAIVLCPPFGFEAVCTHRAYRQLALSLSRAGFSVLRIDYDGTGDSTGDDRDPERVRAWLQSIEFAAEHVCRLSGAAEVGLFGLRLGATLAVVAAAEMAARAKAEGSQTLPVSSLALWAALPTGRAYTRELKMLKQTAELEVAAAEPLVPSPLEPGDDEAAGFLLTKSTIEELSALNLTKLEAAPAGAALLLTRDDLPPDRKLAKSLESVGVELEQAEIAGYAALMQDPHKAAVPEQVFAKVCEWFIAQYPELRPVSPQSSIPEAPVTRIPVSSRESVREELVSFDGSKGTLRGVVTSPLHGPNRDKPGLILLNAGAIRRTGPNRLHVPLARRWASQSGISCLRLDIGGLGDSDGSEEAAEHLYNETTVPDARAAIRFFTEHLGVQKVVLAGLCSGAYVAFHTALEDAAVESIILINPQTFFFQKGASLDVARRTGYQAAQYYRGAIGRKESWLRLVKGEVDVRRALGVLATRSRTVAQDKLKDLRGRLFGYPDNRVLAAMRRVLERGVRVCLLYCQDDPGLEYIEAYLGRELRRLGPKRAEVEMEVVPGPDHTFTPLWSQEWLKERLSVQLGKWT